MLRDTVFVLAASRAGRQGVVVAEVAGELVGMAATSAVELAPLAAAFQLGWGLPGVCLERPKQLAQHAELTACIVNPVFVKSVGALLAGGGVRGRVQPFQACTERGSPVLHCLLLQACCGCRATTACTSGWRPASQCQSGLARCNSRRRGALQPPQQQRLMAQQAASLCTALPSTWHTHPSALSTTG